MIRRVGFEVEAWRLGLGEGGGREMGGGAGS